MNQREYQSGYSLKITQKLEFVFSRGYCVQAPVLPSLLAADI